MPGSMDFVDKITGDGDQKQEDTSSGGGGMMDKLNSMGGGGQASKKNEDYLDKAVDFGQERMGQGDQSNESAVEQAKDEAISDQIRSQYKGAVGSDFPIADKDKKFG